MGRRCEKASWLVEASPINLHTSLESLENQDPVSNLTIEGKANVSVRQPTQRFKSKVIWVSVCSGLVLLVIFVIGLTACKYKQEMKR